MREDIPFCYIRDAVLESLKRFQIEDGHLLQVKSSERSMTHALAVQLQKNSFFKGWHIDCEYNRNSSFLKN